MKGVTRRSPPTRTEAGGRAIVYQSSTVTATSNNGASTPRQSSLADEIAVPQRCRGTGRRCTTPLGRRRRSEAGLEGDLASSSALVGAGAGDHAPGRRSPGATRRPRIALLAAKDMPARCRPASIARRCACSGAMQLHHRPAGQTGVQHGRLYGWGAGRYSLSRLAMELNRQAVAGQVGHQVQERTGSARGMKLSNSVST